MSIQKEFEDILEKNAFERLAPYAEPTAWHGMSRDERELLGILFVKQGEHQLKKREGDVVESFRLATQVAAHSPTVFFQQAVAYSSLGNNLPSLSAAEKALEQATDLDPSFLNAWHAWGNIQVRVGAFNEDMQHFSKANEKFIIAEKLVKNQSTTGADHLYWHWGVCWYHLGKHSGEAGDFFHALDKFRKAEESGCRQGEFYTDYGNILIDLALLNERREFFVEAAEYYKKSVDVAPMHHESWLNLACTHRYLYDLHSTHELFNAADECFDRAAHLDPQQLAIWLRWAELYVADGKVNRDLDRIKASFEKFANGAKCEGDQALLLAKWADAQLLVAGYEEDYGLMCDAEAKICTALAGMPEDPNVWHIYGKCLIEYGRYFSCTDYYRKALEKIQYGLSLDSNLHYLWHSHALACFAIGEIEDDPLMLEKAVDCCAKAAQLLPQTSPPLLNDWGVALMKLGEVTSEKNYIEAATEKFEQAIGCKIEEAQGEDVDLEWLYNYGCAMDFLGDFHEDPAYYEKAVQVLSHIVQVEPSYVLARYNLALALTHLGEMSSEVDCFYRALELFEGLLQQDPEDEIAWNDWGMALLNLAVLVYDPVHPEYGQSLYRLAEGKFLHAAALGNVHTYYNLGCLHSLNNNHAMAMHFLERALSSDALPVLDDIIHDEWLDNIRNTESFRTFISHLLRRHKEF